MRFSRFIPVAFAAIAALPAIAAAQVVSLTNVGPKFPAAIIGGGAQQFAQVGPYLTKLAGSPDASAFDVFCIDYDHPFATATYNARVLTFADAVSTTLSFNGSTNFDALKRALGTTAKLDFTDPASTNIANTSTEYMQRLVIESALAKQFGALPGARWDEIHYAIWALFSNSQTILPDLGVAGAKAELTSATTTATAGGYNFSDWRIIIDANAWTANFTGNLNQTLISTAVVPEPGTYALVGFGLVGLFGAARRRNRAVKK